MPLPCTAGWDSQRSPHIAITRSKARSIWNCASSNHHSQALHECSYFMPEEIMKKHFTILSVAFFVALSAAISLAADGKATSDVTYKSGDESVHGVLYTPAGKGPFPGIIVIHEYWGLNDWVKDQAAKLADEGYEALAIDLYRGKVATTPDMAHELMRGVPEDRAKRDLHAAFEFLQSQPNIKKDRIGAIG